MAPLKVHIKHAGKKHDVELDEEKPPIAFKEAVYQVTGVPVDRMKVMVKGGVLKVCQNFWKFTRKRELNMILLG
jgi:ubiquitin carboxyl-terminal hydrolase 14